ncbi:MAG: hypothetical protein FWB81_03745 [Cystobacterineae bacterium]|nr:hypothetical protein [Cystobacterineae bacterium]
MKKWKLWSLCAFLAMGMACGENNNSKPCVPGSQNTCASGEECIAKEPGATEGSCANPLTVSCEAGGTLCVVAGQTCIDRQCIGEPPGECQGVQNGTACSNTGVCYGNVCRGPSEIPCGTGSGTLCTVAGQSCYQNGCRAPEEIPCGTGDGTLCTVAGQSCYQNSCRVPEEIPCGTGDGTLCTVAGQSCTNGRCRASSCSQESRIYAACYQTGHVAVLSSETQSRVALERVGDSPQALSGVGEVLLCADDGSQQLLRLDAQSLASVGAPVSTEQTPIYLSVSEDGRYVYIVNAGGSGTLQVVNAQTWQTETSMSFGAHTWPQALVFVGDYGFVPLYGDLMSGDTAAGQRLVRLNLSNPTSPSFEGEADFSSLDMHAYGARTPIPLPYDVVVHQGFLYVALSNLADDYRPAGPGAIAKVDPHTLETSVLFLGDECTNVVTLVSNGEVLVASCAGDWSNSGVGLALIENDVLKEIWPTPPGAGFVPGTLAVHCDKLWVANPWRDWRGEWRGESRWAEVYLFSIQEGGLHLLRGEGGSEGGPIETCPSMYNYLDWLEDLETGDYDWVGLESLWLKI